MAAKRRSDTGPLRAQSPAEEIANSVSHGAGLLAALVGAPFLVARAARADDLAFLAGACLFATTVILAYLASTIYHALPAGRAKQVSRVLDHAAIFLLIAGTYAPFALGVLRGALGWTLFGIVWALALTGIVLRIFSYRSRPVMFTILYLAMGWMVVAVLDPLIESVPAAGVLWLAAGGVSYTVGVLFFATGSFLRFGHSVWHLFVVAGTACHYCAVLWYAA